MVSSERLPLERFSSEDVTKDISSDAVKESALVVDSSLKESKFDNENCDNPGSSSSKENVDPPKAEKQVDQQKGVQNLSSVKTNRQYATKYFIIKSLNHHNLELSVERGIWATQVMNEPILEGAFDKSGRVILIFSVNMSGCFQGYAQMMSSVGWRRDNVWTEASGGTIPWGRTFKVKWLQLHNLPFQRTLHLKNPLNDYKPVKISRDCQELPHDIGEALCRLIDESVDLEGRMRRNTFCRNELHQQRPCLDFPACLPDEDFGPNVSPQHMGWDRMSMFPPSLSHPQVRQAEASTLHASHGRSRRKFLPENLSANFEASAVSRLNNSCAYPSNLLEGKEYFSPITDNLSSKKSFLADPLSDDDFLQMTYEEYLEATRRRNNPSHHQVPGALWSMQEASSSRGSVDWRYMQHF